MIYKHADMDDLRDEAASCDAAQRKLIVTDGVFSMEGDLAQLPDIVELAREYDAIVIGRRLARHGRPRRDRAGRGRALRPARARSTSSPARSAKRWAAPPAASSPRAPQVCDFLAQRSRPQLFSNALPPTVACSALAASRCCEAEPARVERLPRARDYFRDRLREIGFRPLEGEAAIIPIIVGETALAIRAQPEAARRGRLRHRLRLPGRAGGTARIRVQISAALEPKHLDRALEAFEKVGHEAGLLVA